MTAATHEDGVETIGVVSSILMVLAGLLVAISPALIELWLVF